MRTSLAIWAFGPMATRFNPGGYKPDLAASRIAGRVRTAVAGLDGLIDDYEFHYPEAERWSPGADGVLFAPYLRPLEEPSQG